jgi:ATP-binding cassette subfamily B protein
LFYLTNPERRCANRMQNPGRETSTGPSNWHLIKRQLSLAWGYRRECIRVLAFQVVLLTLGLTGLQASGKAIDVIRFTVDPRAKPPTWPRWFVPPTTWTTMRIIFVLGSAVLVMAAIRAGLNYFLQVSVGKLVQLKVVPALRAQVYDKLQRLSFRFFDANASGSIINRVSGDVQMVRAFIDVVLLPSIIMVLSLGIYLFFMLSTHVGLTLACLAATPLLFLTTRAFSKKVRPLYRKNRRLVDDMILALSEGLQGIQVTKGFGREKEEYERFVSTNVLVRDQQQRQFWAESIFAPSMNLLSQTSVVILLAYGGMLTVRGTLSLGELIVFSALLQQFSGQVQATSGIINSVQMSLVAARRVYEVIDAPIEIKNPESPKRPETVRGAVRFDKVDFAYQETDDLVLRGLDINVEPGQCVAIMGSTGSGKSTLLSLILRFYDPIQGRVLIDGIDVRDWNVDELRRHIGIVFQESFLFSNTIAANIAFGQPAATLGQIKRAAKIAAADEFIRGLSKGYDTVLSESGANLSGGQRQRIAIARALLLEPALLLLDDPTASVDPETEHEILDAVERAIKGRTTFIVAHRLSTLRRADVILVLEGGRIVERGTHDELMEKGGYYRKAAMLQIADDESVRLLGGK